jgi:hypothetical protein
MRYRDQGHSVATFTHNIHATDTRRSTVTTMTTTTTTSTTAVVALHSAAMLQGAVVASCSRSLKHYSGYTTVPTTLLSFPAAEAAFSELYLYS